MSERTHAELLISKAYAKLSAIPKDGSRASVSLASMGSYEHGTRRSIDSFICHQVKDAAPMFEEFMSHAAYLNKSQPGGSKEQ
jgi:hypothetical protein